jgi:hypothetical protein
VNDFHHGLGTNTGGGREVHATAGSVEIQMHKYGAVTIANAGETTGLQVAVQPLPPDPVRVSSLRALQFPINQFNL